MDAEKVLLHAVVRGEVQGVGFRATTRYLAQSLNLKGMVKNLENGNVEIYAEGARADIEKLLEALQKHFGEYYIQEIEKEYLAPSQNFTDFRIAY